MWTKTVQRPTNSKYKTLETGKWYRLKIEFFWLFQKKNIWSEKDIYKD